MATPKTIRGPVTTKLESPLMQSAATSRRLDALFRASSNDFLLREQFVTDPAQILSEYVRGSALPAATASVTNHLIYSVFANNSLRHWLVQYARAHQASAPPREQFLHDFSQAVARAGDHSVVAGLVRSSVEKSGGAGFEAFEWMVLALGAILREKGTGLTGGPPTGGPPTGGPPTGGPPTGGPPTGGPPTGGPPTGGPPTGGPPTGGPPTGGPPTGGPPTGGPPTGGPPTGGSAFFNRLPDYILVAINELVRYSVSLRERGALNIGGFRFQPGP